MDLLRTLNIYHPALADGVCSTQHPYLEVILCRGSLGSNMRPNGASIKSGGITHPGLPGMPKGEVLSRMNRILAAEGREALWQVFLRFDPRRKPIFHDLDDRGRD